MPRNRLKVELDLTIEGADALRKVTSLGTLCESDAYLRQCGLRHPPEQRAARLAAQQLGERLARAVTQERARRMDWGKGMSRDA